MLARFVTVGHSTRDLDEFIEMLRAAQLTLVADVRSFPKSRANPDYNINSFPDVLSNYQIKYRHFDDLGGRRKKQPEIDDDVNSLWRVRSFHNYADYALSAPFEDAFNQLVASGRDDRIAIMCAEAVWWRCHRRIVADYLLLNDHPVDH